MNLDSDFTQGGYDQQQRLEYTTDINRDNNTIINSQITSIIDQDGGELTNRELLQKQNNTNISFNQKNINYFAGENNKSSLSIKDFHPRSPRKSSNYRTQVVLKNNNLVSREGSPPTNNRSRHQTLKHATQLRNIVEEKINKKILRQKKNLRYEKYSDLYLLKNISIVTALKVRKFAQKMIYSLRSRHFRNLKNLHYNLIYDEAAVNPNQSQEDKDEQKPFFQSSQFEQCRQQLGKYMLFNFLGKLLGQIPVFKPSAYFKLLWDLVQVINILIFFFFIPVHIALNDSMDELMGSSFRYLCIVIVFLDIFISMNTGYYDKGEQILDRQKVLRNYFKKQMTVDVFVNFVLFTSDTFPGAQWIDVLFFVKLKMFKKMMKKIEESFNLTYKASSLISLFKLLFTIIFVNHIFACIWIFVANYLTHDHDRNWMDKKDIRNADWPTQYLYAYYYTALTMITVGFGDIVPENRTEVLVCILTMFLACGVFAYSINNIGQIFQNLFQEDNEVKNKLLTINHYMQQKNIPFELQFKVREYLEYFWRESHDANIEQEEKIIAQLNDQLKDQIKLQANKIVLKDSPIFKSNFSDKFINKCVSIIQQTHCEPEQVIETDYEYNNDTFIYFIEKGKVEFYFENYKPRSGVKIRQLKKLSQGDYFGEYAFFTGQKQKYKIRSLEFSKFLIIERKKFLKLLYDFPEDYEAFCYIKDQLIYSANLFLLGQSCLSCNQKTHDFLSCPLLHYSVDNYKVIKIYNQSHEQKRQPQQRNRQDGSQCYKNIQTIQEQAFNVIENNASFILQQEWYEKSDISSDLYTTSQVSTFSSGSSSSGDSSDSSGSDYLNSQDDIEEVNSVDYSPNSINLHHNDHSISSSKSKKSNKNLDNSIDIHLSKQKNKLNMSQTNNNNLLNSSVERSFFSKTYSRQQSNRSESKLSRHSSLNTNNEFLNGSLVQGKMFNKSPENTNNVIIDEYEEIYHDTQKKNRNSLDSNSIKQENIQNNHYFNKKPNNKNNRSQSPRMEESINMMSFNNNEEQERVNYEILDNDEIKMPKETFQIRIIPTETQQQQQQQLQDAKNNQQQQLQQKRKKKQSFEDKEKKKEKIRQKRKSQNRKSRTFVLNQINKMIDSNSVLKNIHNNNNGTTTSNKKQNLQVDRKHQKLRHRKSCVDLGSPIIQNSIKQSSQRMIDLKNINNYQIQNEPLKNSRVSSLTKINFENEKSPNNNNFNNNNVLISSKDQKAILKNKLLSQAKSTLNYSKLNSSKLMKSKKENDLNSNNKFLAMEVKSPINQQEKQQQLNKAAYPSLNSLASKQELISPLVTKHQQQKRLQYDQFPFNSNQGIQISPKTAKSPSQDNNIIGNNSPFLLGVNQQEFIRNNRPSQIRISPRQQQQQNYGYSNTIQLQQPNNLALPKKMLQSANNEQIITRINNPQQQQLNRQQTQDYNLIQKAVNPGNSRNLESVIQFQQQYLQNYNNQQQQQQQQQNIGSSNNLNRFKQRMSYILPQHQNFNSNKQIEQNNNNQQKLSYRHSQIQDMILQQQNNNQNVNNVNNQLMNSGDNGNINNNNNNQSFYDQQYWEQDAYFYDNMFQILPEFDYAKLYETYFSLFNYDRIIQKFNLIQRKKQTKQTKHIAKKNTQKLQFQNKLLRKKNSSRKFTSQMSESYSHAKKYKFQPKAIELSSKRDSADGLICKTEFKKSIVQDFPISINLSKFNKESNFNNNKNSKDGDQDSIEGSSSQNIDSGLNGKQQ